LDLAPLEALGKVAGIGGIAVGAVVLIIRGIIDKTSSVPAKQQASTLRLLAMGAFGIGALGILAWVGTSLSSGQHASTRGHDSPAVIGGGNVTIGPTNVTGPSVPGPKTDLPPNATANTTGNRSPAIISGGDATVSPPSKSPTTNSP
jgi:hypothetical protein